MVDNPLSDRESLTLVETMSLGYGSFDKQESTTTIWLFESAVSIYLSMTLQKIQCLPPYLNVFTGLAQVMQGDFEISIMDLKEL